MRCAFFLVVEDFDVLKQAGFGLLVVLVFVSVNQLLFEGGEEAFERRIVPAIALATHAAYNAPILKLFPIAARRVLAAPITMEEQLFHHRPI